jgi:hypothetical protein
MKMDYFFYEHIIRQSGLKISIVNIFCYREYRVQKPSALIRLIRIIRVLYPPLRKSVKSACIRVLLLPFILQMAIGTITPPHTCGKNREYLLSS